MANITIYWGNSEPSTTLQYRVTGEVTWNSVSVSNMIQYTVTSLLDNTLYDFRIQRVCDSVITNSPITQNFVGTSVVIGSNLTSSNYVYSYSVLSYANITGVENRLYRNGILLTKNIVVPSSSSQTGSFNVNGFDGVYSMSVHFNIRGFNFDAGVSDELYLTCNTPTNFTYIIT